MDKEDIMDYFRLVQLNEMVFGQTYEYIYATNLRHGFHFNFDFSNLFICVSGLEKRVYTPYLHITTAEYVRVQMLFKHEILTYFASVFCTREVSLLSYSPNKQIFIIFSMADNCPVSEIEIANKMHCTLQNILETEFQSCEKQIVNFTALSHRVTSYEQIEAAFSRTLNLHQLSFFLAPHPEVLTEELYLTLKNDFTLQDAFDMLHSLGESIMGEMRLKRRAFFPSCF